MLRPVYGVRTRDASINAWNGASLILPDVARNTLLSVLDRTDGGVRIGGQYWDCIVWTTGAWHHYLPAFKDRWVFARERARLAWE